MTEPAKYVLLKVSDRSSFLVGRLIDETDAEIILHFPVIMTIGIDDTDELNVNASKWFPFAEGDVVQIPKESIIAVATPKKNILDYYHRFANAMPDLMDDTLENKVLARSEASVTPVPDSEWIPSSALH
ncbi:hypothetical protein AAY80_023 [Stenotrophomonas phage vB_SmaS-DLP_6]|nr:hypothetical protein AAY80_023 [Stenotrophomonas phage vB_SmaS-DLP_6]